MSDKKFYMTPQCHASFRAELKELLYKTRPHYQEMVSWAASLGDRSENEDYRHNKRKLRQVDSRIRFIQKRLDDAEVVDPVAQGKIANGRVLFGATVTVEDEEGEEKTYSIVGVDEYDAGKGKVSWISPIGKALLKAQEGDVVTFKAPGGDRELEIIEIQYIPIPE